MLQTFDYEQLKELNGHEVVSADGEKIGYIDLIFRDERTGEPEWLGVWDGLPDTSPRVLVPVQGVEVDGDRVRVPWSGEVIRNAPSYEPPHNLVTGRDHVVEISPETDSAAYDHYGIEPMTTRGEADQVVRFRIWRIQMF